MSGIHRLFIGFFVAWSIFLLETAQAAWAPTGPMPSPRGDHTATLLTDGRVLVAGGIGQGSSIATLYEPATGAWTTTGALPTKRYDHTATLLPNGKVLVAGGSNGKAVLASAMLFDPATGRWTATRAMPAARMYHTATLLADGKVLVAGGWNGSSFLASAALYDPATGKWMTARAMPATRGHHTATLLTDGKVLVAGGMNRKSSLSSAVLYDSVTGKWAATGAMPVVRNSHTATLLTDGKVLVAGGDDGTSGLSSATLYDPATATWTDTGDMPTAPSAHTATLLGDGKVLVAGGYDSNGALSSAALYDPTIGVWIGTGAIPTERSSHTATLLGDGKVLVAGGYNSNGALSSAALYVSDSLGPLADFLVTDITLKPTAPGPNTPFTAEVTIQNVGAGVADGGQLRVWADKSGAGCNDSDGQTAAIGVLNPGASLTLTFSGLQATSPGIKTFRAFVDANCIAPESDEINNQRTLAYRVRGGADFAISTIMLIPPSPLANTNFNALVTVTNQGTEPGTVGYLDVWGDQTTPQECGAEGDAWTGMGSLAPGESITVSLSLNSGTEGTKTLRAFTDSWCATFEANEGNNQVTLDYNVQ